MKNAIFASAALVAGAVAQIGNAIVVNSCDYDVYLFNTPSANGGYSEIDKVLSPNGQYEQEWTELTNGNGWSIKLSNSTSLANILQYEYTFHDDGTIWYDLSEVNGNPWDGNWEITSSDTSICSPKQQAYRYATDDAYGMQACPQAASITVTLCSGDSSDDAAASSASSSVAAASTSAKAKTSTLGASTTEAAPATITVVTSTSSTKAAATTTSTPSSSKVVTTTMITSTITSSAEVSNAVVTVTSAATTTYWTRHWGPPSKREAHVHNHAARHPHARA